MGGTCEEAVARMEVTTSDDPDSIYLIESRGMVLLGGATRLTPGEYPAQWQNHRTRLSVTANFKKKTRVVTFAVVSQHRRSSTESATASRQQGGAQSRPTGSPIADPSRVFLGVVFDSKSATLKSVVPGGPADRAAIKAGDMLVYINGRHTANAEEAVAEANKSNPGDIVKVSYVHQGKLYDTELTLTAAPKSYQRPAGSY